MVRKVFVSLGSLLADAQERGLVGRNMVREKSRRRQKGFKGNRSGFIRTHPAGAALR